MRRRSLLSVIIPVYNGGRFLGQAVASVLRQRYQPIEIIVVDDGSIDDLIAAVEALPVDVRFVRQLNRGPAAARNRGLEEASGELVAFLDVDDLWPVDTIEMLASRLVELPDIEVARGRGRLVQTDEDGVVAAELGTIEESFPDYIGAALFRRSAFEKIGMFDPSMRFGEDSDWFVRAQQYHLPMARIEQTTLLVRRHGGNMTEGKSLIELNVLAVLKKAIDRKRVMQGDRMGAAETHG
jgi:glycosyltransferase involved in cell wall biosynthesis